MANGLWLFKDRLTLNAQYCPKWQHGGLCFHENGGRKASECLDMTLVLYKLNLGMTIWGLGRLSLLTRWIPCRRNGRGWVIGWLRLVERVAERSKGEGEEG